MEPWKTISRQLLMNHSKFLAVESHTIQLPDGRTIADWPWLITPDYINAVAVTEEGEFLCFRQTKYAVDGLTLAVTGGFIDPGENPLAAAQRELLEETGYTAPEWTNLGQYVVDGNRGAGTAHLFLARGACRTTRPNADDLEEQELLLLTRTQIETALANGEFKVLPNATVVALALLQLNP